MQTVGARTCARARASPTPPAGGAQQRAAARAHPCPPSRAARAAAPRPAPMDRVFEKAFARCHTTVNAALPRDGGGAKAAAAASEEERMRSDAAPMTAADAVARITLAYKDGDYFRWVAVGGPTGWVGGEGRACVVVGDARAPEGRGARARPRARLNASTPFFPPCLFHAPRLLQLPRPDADELGRPVWACSDGDISRAYRKLSVLVHPDKVGGGWKWGCGR